MLPRISALILSGVVLLAGCASPSAGTMTPVFRSAPPTPAGVYDIGQVQTQPRATRQGAPRYPRELRQARVSGEATIYFIVSRDGQVTNAITVKADDERFGEAAREAILQWRFEPARVDGKPVDCAMMVPITFSVER